MQKSRFDDQRCHFKPTTDDIGNNNNNHTLHGHCMY
jgi:hypothetical protein